MEYLSSNLNSCWNITQKHKIQDGLNWSQNNVLFDWIKVIYKKQIIIWKWKIQDVLIWPQK